MKYSGWGVLSVVVSSMALSSLSYAASEPDYRGWYVGLGVGSSKYDPDVRVSMLNDSDTSYTVFGGYRFNRYFALQGNSIDFGPYEGNSDRFRSSEELSGFSMTAVGILPITGSDFDVFGRLGLASIDFEQTITRIDETFLSGFTLSTESSGNGLAASLGVNYTPSSFDKLTFHFGYDIVYFETTTSLDDGPTDPNSVTLIGAGARYNF